MLPRRSGTGSLVFLFFLYTVPVKLTCFHLSAVHNKICGANLQRRGAAYSAISAPINSAAHVRTAPCGGVTFFPRGCIQPLFAQLPFQPPPPSVDLGGNFGCEGFRGYRHCSPQSSRPFRYAEANARYLRLSPIKTRRVIQEIKNKNLAGALAHLAMSPRRPAYAIFRTIESALANAVHCYGDSGIKPALVSVTAVHGPVLKRPCYRAKGKLDIWRRPTTHIKVILRV